MVQQSAAKSILDSELGDDLPSRTREPDAWQGIGLSKPT